MKHEPKSEYHIHGLLETRGKTRCLGGVSVYWMVIRTAIMPAKQRTSYSINYVFTPIIESLHKKLKSPPCDIKIFPALSWAIV